MIDLLVLRHFETSWSHEKRIQGHLDIPLSPLTTPFKLPKIFNDFTFVSSPLLRAQQTAFLLKIHPQVEPALIEMNYGRWQGLYTAEIDPFEQAKGLDMTPPHGESPRQVMKRVHAWIGKLQTPTFAITHKGVIRSMLALATGWDMTTDFREKIDWKAFHHFKIKDGNLSLHELNIPLHGDLA